MANNQFQQLISKIILITHPAYPVTYPESVDKEDKEFRRTPKQVNDYIEKELLPVLDAASKNQNTLVVLLKSPPFARTIDELKVTDKEGISGLRRKYGISRRREVAMQIIENKLWERILQKVGPKRAHLFKEPYNPYDLELIQIAALQTTQEIATNLMITQPFLRKKGLVIDAYGSWADKCASEIPVHLAAWLRQFGLKKLRITAPHDFRETPTKKRAMERVAHVTIQRRGFYYIPRAGNFGPRQARNLTPKPKQKGPILTVGGLHPELHRHNLLRRR